MHLTAPVTLVAIDRNRWARSVGTSGHDRRNAQVSATSKFVPARPELKCQLIAIFTLRRHIAECHYAANIDRGKNHDPGSGDVIRS